ncbi:DUF3868 domain-containing protein [Parabacteroides faecis]|uniref:Outer membrane protein OmpA-like peptidoglycan-associated protein n=2 Tax=Parabacteroides faecis TaxID=1217282 RepID=A0ABR6KJ28_9BACT|nr:DUF3868 domain-containing protein [Parabacteroides faecis]MBB4621511.1 outer membrane protein OmpA-like peptidoglycan-associated protein [Parabacteroides faecis]GGJ86015.1 hypothetical protein GCM10007084_07070 [Parabacteroides faecis]
MKQIILHYILCISGLLLLLPLDTLEAQGIRIVPQRISVKNDSLHVQLRMDLNEVRVGRNRAFIFTPQLLGAGKQQVSLPAVVISGSIRDRQDRREAALSLCKECTVPYLRIRDSRNVSKNITYHISIPYASWMQHAMLLLKQESRECCGNELLAVDTLQCDLGLAAVAGIPQLPVVKMKLHPEEAVKPKVVKPEPAAVTRPKSTMVSTSKVASATTESVVLYFDYPIGKDDIHPDLKNNRYEIDKIDRLIAPLQRTHFASVKSIRICGYCSPDGNYGDNERLAEARSRFFSIYLRSMYGVPRGLVKVSSVAEDWEGLVDLLMRDNPPYRDAALRVISRYGIFNGREKYLMELQGGSPYKDMLRHFFPKLRRIEVIVRYEEDKTEVE